MGVRSCRIGMACGKHRCHGRYRGDSRGQQLKGYQMKVQVPEMILERLKKAEKEIVKHHGKDVYEAAVNGQYSPPAIMSLIEHPDRELMLK
jgi:hypothetical protein